MGTRLEHPRAGGASHRLGAEPVAIMYIVAGFLAIANGFALSADLSPQRIIALGAIDVLMGAAILILPWKRWSPRATLLLLPPTLVLIQVFALNGLLSDGTYPIFFVLIHIWVGVAHPPRTGYLIAPLVLLAYLSPLVTGAEIDDVAHSAGLIIPVCILVAEVLSRAETSAREAERRAAELAHAGMLERTTRQRDEATTRLAAVGSQLPGVVWTTDRNLLVTWVSGILMEEAEESFSLHGRHLLEIYGTGDPRFPPLFAHLEAIEGRNGQFEIAFLDDRVLKCSVKPLLDGGGEVIGTVGVGLDVTDLKRVEEELEIKTQRYSSLFEQNPAGVFSLDMDGRFTGLNRAIGLLAGYEDHELLGLHFTAVVQDEDRNRAEAVFATVCSGTASEFEFEMIHKDGNTRTVEGAALPIVVAEKVRGLFGIIRDVTAEHRLEAQLQQARKLESVGQLAGGIAHDFNNLLSVILNYARFVADELDTSDPRQEDIQEVIRAAQQASHLIRQLLTFSRRDIVTPSVVDLNQVISDTARMLRRMIPEHIVLKTELSPDLGNVFIDPCQIEQIILNLAVNASDAMPRGGQLTLVTGNQVVGENEAAVDVKPGEYVSLRVCDTGQGIAEAHIGRIFDPFFTTKPVGKGTGLGLATVYGIVQHAGGSISVDSHLDQGTSFTLLLPRSTCSPTDDAPGGSALPDHTGETIMVVEDDRTVLDVVVRILGNHGYVVRAFDRPSEALGDFTSRPESGVDLLLTDIMMPGMGGQELSIAMGLPTLFMTGYAALHSSGHGFSLPRGSVLPKPFEEVELLRAIRTALDERRPAPCSEVVTSGSNMGARP